MNSKRFALIIFLLFLSTFLHAEKITFTADSMTGSTKGDNSATVLQGEAYIKTQSMEISGDRIELSGEDYRMIKAEGNIKGKNFDSGLEFTCETLEYDRKTKIATLKNNVDLEDTENAVKAKAQVIEYNSDTDIATLQINVDLRQKDNVCTASYAVYHKKDQMLNLSGNAQIKQKDDTFRAQHITLNMTTEEITLDGRVKGTVTEKSEPKPEPEKKVSETVIPAEEKGSSENSLDEPLTESSDE